VRGKVSAVRVLTYEDDIVRGIDRTVSVMSGGMDEKYQGGARERRLADLQWKQRDAIRNCDIASSDQSFLLGRRM
jgi:hypothetical protein